MTKGTKPQNRGEGFPTTGFGSPRKIGKSIVAPTDNRPPSLKKG